MASCMAYSFARVTVVRLYMINRKYLGLMTVLATLFVMWEAAAASSTSTSSMAVSATVLSACMVSILPLSFGIEPAPGSARDASTAMTASCVSAGTPTAYTIRFDQGGAADATTVSRTMTGPDGKLVNYPFYREAGRTTVWGIAVGTDGIAQTTGPSPTILKVYGRRVPAAGIPAAADFDIVNVTLTF